MEQINYRALEKIEINRALFCGFIRRQEVTDCLRRENGVWVIKSDPFLDDWTEADYRELLEGLTHTAAGGGFVYAAFDGKVLKGFVSVEPDLFGGNLRYLDLSNIYVSADARRRGIGRKLFLEAVAWAREKGAKRLYISAHSAVESQAFYKAAGCAEAEQYSRRHVEKEPFDCQMEYLIDGNDAI